MESSAGNITGRVGWVRRALPSLGVLVVLSIWLIPISLGRLIDADEGYLLMAARLVSEGRWPYRDFFLPQAPLLPAVFAAVFVLFGRSWMVARVFAGVVAVAMGWLVYREALSSTRRQTSGLFAAALFCLSGSTIGWLTIVKGYGLATLFLLLAVYLVGNVVRAKDKPEQKSDRRMVVETVVAGLGAGLAASTRLYVVLVMPALFVYLLGKLGLGRAALRKAGLFAVGSVLGLSPTLVCFVRTPKAFWFNTVRYHAVREFGQDSLLGTVGAKLSPVLKTMGIDALASYGQRQWMAFAIVAVLAAVARVFWRNRSSSPALLVALVLLAASVLPNPFQSQYLCMAIPFFAIEAGRLLGTVLDRVVLLPRRWTFLAAAATAAYLVYNAWVGIYDRHRFLYTGVAVDGVETSDRIARWQIPTVEAVARAIDAQHIATGASWWPGYFVSSKTAVVVELANVFGFRAAAVLPPEQRRRLHVVTDSEVAEMIGRRQPRLYVEGNWANSGTAARLALSGYQVRATIENARVWTVE
jgi:hypothetical protein